MKRRNIVIISSVVAILLLVWIFNSGSSDDSTSVKVAVKKGRFEVTVTTTGELKAKNSEDIKGPQTRSVGIYTLTIQDLIPEGTVVKKGDWIATLDRTDISTKLQTLSTELQKIESQYLQIKLDTTLNLREARNNLVNLKYAMEERRITLDQSKYEPPATIRQAEIDMDKADRAYDQARDNYVLKVRQAKAKIQEVAATLSQQQAKFDRMNDLVEKFTITAPMDGMLIYIRDWNGKKKEVGSTIQTWGGSAVATLPDLSVMVSKTYVNEVEIRKVKKDQTVKVGVDAFPEKSFKGKVVEVANIGEQKPNSDAKVFEVTIELSETDTLLRPSMTTSNDILADVQEDALFLPLETIHSNDSVTFVYRAGGFRTYRQEVELGVSNNNEVVITAGLKEGDIVYLSLPPQEDDLKLVKLKTSK